MFGFDDLAPEKHMREPEPTAHQAAVTKESFYLLGQCIGCDIEVFRLQANQQVADTTADEKPHEPRVAKFVENPQRIGRDM